MKSFRGCLQVKPRARCWASKRGDSTYQRVPRCPAVPGRRQSPAALHPRSCTSPTHTHISQLARLGALRQQLPHAPGPRDCRKAEPKAKAAGDTPRIFPRVSESSRDAQPGASPSQTPPSAPFSSRQERRKALRGCCWHSQPHQDPIPTPEVRSGAGAAAEDQPCPQRSTAPCAGRGDADLFRGFSSARPLFSF